MLTITEHIGNFDTWHELLDYEPEHSLFFDIETTGFSPASSIVFLIGMLYLENGKWKLTQLLAEQPDDEPSLLQSFLEFAHRYETLIHFNGSTFDLPYLTKKAEHFHLPHTLDRCRSLDLYQSFRPAGKMLSLEQMKQQSLEAFIGWKRTDQLTGKDMVSLFHEYARNGFCDHLRELLLLHNHDDMLGMTELLPIAAYLPLQKGILGSVTGCSYQEPSHLQLSFSLTAPVPIPFSLGKLQLPERGAESAPFASQGFTLSAEGKRGTLCVPACRGTLLHFFPDYKNYYYLPLEDEAIHKSVASFVDKSYRRPAKACNCYMKKSGTFFPQPEEIVSPAFQRSFKEAPLYFICSEDFIQNTKLQETYLSSVLRALLS